MAYPVIARGSKIGIHSIWPNRTVPLVKAAVERGVTWPVVKSVDNAGVPLDVKRLSPRTLTLARFVNERWDAAQDVQTWDEAKMRQAARETVQLIFDRTNAEERAAVDYFEPLNEADPPGEDGWRAFGRFLCAVVREAGARGVRLALPAFNAGTPEWGEMLALCETGVFGLMQAGGHLLTIHEGVFGSDQPVDFGYGELIPGAPPVEGAGTLCFRYRYLYHLLQQRGEVVPVIVSEFYGGGGYDLALPEVIRRFEWYDRRAREDWYVLAVLPFTVDPSPGWRHSDYTYAYDAVLDYLVRECDQPNAVSAATPAPPGPVTPMPPGPVSPGPTPEPPPAPPEPAPAGTHRVTAAELNVRLHPWTGAAVPPKVRSLFQGDVVTVLGVYQAPGMAFGWACLSPDGNEWVTLEYLEPIG